MVRTGEVRPNDNKIRALAQNVRHRDGIILMSFFILIKRDSVLMPSVCLLRAFFYSRILTIEKTFGGDAVFSRLLENKESFVMRKSLIEINRPETKRFGDYR